MAVGITALLLAACGTSQQQRQQQAQVQKTADTPLVTLDQGWSEELRDAYYFTPQGSRMMPYAWFVALERATDTTLFASPDNMQRYGWIHAREPSPRNPDNLPIGFARDPVDLPGTGPWIGLSCAACHTNDVTYRGRTIRVDGAPTLVDFVSFIAEMEEAVDATRVDEAKFRRFAARVLETSEPTPEQRDALLAAFTAFSAQLGGRVAILAQHPPGPGRLDALTQIVNTLSTIELKHPTNLRPPIAPVSYPHLWLTPMLDWVQWAPVASSPLERNVGEVLGVFGQAELTGPQQQIFTSSVLIEQLRDMESWLRDLEPPAWREDILGPIDRKLATRGRQLFEQDCRGCHNMPPFDLTPKEMSIAGKQFIEITAVPFREVGTDPVYSLMLLTRVLETGPLASILFEGKPVVPYLAFFLDSVEAVVNRSLADAQLSPEQVLEYSDYRFYPLEPGQAHPQPWRPEAMDTLKAGPLLGIWATGPFLHNGSVPNIYQLLSPPEQRSDVFWVGSRELDTRKLGFLSTQEDLSPSQRATLYRFDTSLPGNSNRGHVYPSRGYSHAEKRAVIEYLKLATLPR